MHSALLDNHVDDPTDVVIAVTSIHATPRRHAHARAPYCCWFEMRPSRTSGITREANPWGKSPIPRRIRARSAALSRFPSDGRLQIHEMALLRRLDETILLCQWNSSPLLMTNSLSSSRGLRTLRRNDGLEVLIGHGWLSTWPTLPSPSSEVLGKRGATNSWRGTGIRPLAIPTAVPATDALDPVSDWEGIVYYARKRT
jgi:hypothetical protein